MTYKLRFFADFCLALTASQTLIRGSLELCCLSRGMSLHSAHLAAKPSHLLLLMTPPSPSKSENQILQVAVPTPLRRLFDYLPPASPNKKIVIGARVSVPFGARTVIGIVIKKNDRSEISRDKLRRISKVLDDISCLPTSLFNTLLWAANYYQHPIGEAFYTALPLKLRQGAPLHEKKIVWKRKQEEALESDVEKLGRAHRQRELLKFIATNGPSNPDILKQQGFDTALIKKLESSGFIMSETLKNRESSSFNTEIKAKPESIKLSEEQAVSLEKIESTKGFSCILLNGITGSGKTEVYMRAMENYLLAGKQCLVLVPEIGLTPQTVSRFEERFSCPVVSLHSNLSDGERLMAWRQANSGEAGIIIGTRSAVFTPLAKPGLIVVDEEHDSSFKQQEGFRYSARDFAIKRAQADDIPIILGSATPSLESLKNANSNKYLQLRLAQRAGKAEPAPMQILDVSESKLEQGFSELLLFKIEQHLAAGNQVLVFINRRGYAPVLQCMDCGWLAECNDCVAQLTVHSQPPALRCHHCDSVSSIPATCPNCLSHRLHTLGAGTQKIEQFLQQQFPDEAVIRIDRDSTRNKKTWQALIDKIHTGKPSILLGTQMLAKGHHFPHVTLVAIVDADAGLFSADFRGQEQMAQTIVQVAGRAGRADKPGEVFIQSRHAAHPALQRLTELPYTEYAEMLLKERKSAGMPPFSYLSLLRIEGEKIPATLNLANELKDRAATLAAANVEIIGPIPAPMEKRAGKYRLQILAKSSNRGELQRFLAQLCHSLDQSKFSSGARWSLDVDPVDLI